LEATLHRAQIVEGGNHYVRDAGLRHAQSAGNRNGSMHIAKIRCMRLNTDQRAVMQPVIGAFELYDLVAPSSSASQADGMHSGFRTARTEADHFNWEALADFFGQLPFHVMGHAKHRAHA